MALSAQAHVERRFKMHNSVILVSYARVKMKHGEYRIVAKFEGFCAANIPVMIGAVIPLHPRSLAMEQNRPWTGLMVQHLDQSPSATWRSAFVGCIVCR